MQISPVKHSPARKVVDVAEGIENMVSRKILIFSILLGVKLLNSQETGNVDSTAVKVCDTKDCYILAAEIKSGMNESADPCEDFYDFVCGTWADNNPIPKYTVSWGRPELFQETVQKRIGDILKEKPNPSDILPVRQAKKWYQSCMDIETLNKRGIKPLESILMQMGGWPLVMDREEWDDSENSWQTIEKHYLHLTGSYVFYDVGKTPFSGDNLLLIAKVGRAADNELQGLDFSKLASNESHAYEEFIEKVALMFVEHNRANVSLKMIEEDVHKLVRFEKELAEIEDSIDAGPEGMELDEFLNWFKMNITDGETNDLIVEQVDFKDLIKRMLDTINEELMDPVNITVITPGYMIEIVKLLNRTETRTIVNYIHWKFVSKMIVHTTEDMRDIFFQLRQDTMGVEVREPRTLECVQLVEMTQALSYAFVKKYFSKKTEEAAQELIDGIRVELEFQMDQSKWLDEDSRKLMKEKLHAIRSITGSFPDWYNNNTYVVNYYKGLTIGYDLFDNILSYQKYEKKKSFKMTREQFFEKLFGSDDYATVINAFYSPDENTIELPAAIFQPPLFTTDLPSFVNYGTIGSIVGHEIGHGFDSYGIKYGKDGNTTKVSKQILNMYYKRAECFYDQFNEYQGVTEADYVDSTPSYGMGSFGRRTSGENIADTTGLHAIYEAYTRMIKKRGIKDNALPGFENYTPEQMLFISFGTMYCGAYVPQLADIETQGVHSPRKLRVIGPVSNNDDFSRVFNCPKGKPMNPENRCGIWKSPHFHDNEEKKETKILKSKDELFKQPSW